MASKYWGHMTAQERLTASVDYLAFNYGERHTYTQAAREGDMASFRQAAAHVTEMMDAKIVSILNRQIAEKKGWA